MSTNRVITIVPTLPPVVSGVGDYGFLLAQQLHQDFGTVTDFVVGDPAWVDTDYMGKLPANQVRERSLATLVELLSQRSQFSPKVILHYAGHGYAKRGCPVWLVDALEQWRSTTPNTSLITMFHEVYATGPFWTSALLTSPLQKHLATRLIRLSDRCFTSKQGYASMISKLSQAKHFEVPTLPVFSTVGEPNNPPLLVERPRWLVVFGGQGARARVYQRSRSALERTCQELAIDAIIDIGPKLNFNLEPINGIPVTVLGIKPLGEISHLLLNSVVGFFDYPTQFLAKSTIFAAYCAHRVIPIGVFYDKLNVDGLQANQHYWLANRLLEKMSSIAGQTIANQAHTWYKAHRLSVQAHIFADALML